MPKVRDPLSLFYDDFSERFLAICRADLMGWHTATVRSPARDPVDVRGLSAHERAVTRSLYYVLNSTADAGPLGGRWVKNQYESLEIGGWSRPAYSGGPVARLLRSGPRVRILTARMTPGSTAMQFVEPQEAYTLDPALQSQNVGIP